ncbi:MAG: DUF3021 domain-containing protein, partial [Clostridia bacterium]|nr:DUF3021 domain-containing protein [Clostridia bacterium]
KFAAEFVKRGLMAAWGGPVVIAIIFAILGANGVMETMTVHEVCLGILSSTVMTFVAGGITAIYQVERLPLPMAALIQAGVLYLDYLLVYLMNGWLQNQMVPILTFTVIFVAGYALIWLVIYQVIKRQTQKLNEKLTAQ